MLTAADSNAGGMQVVSVRHPDDFKKPLPEKASNGAPLDGRGGESTRPFGAAPDQFGNRLRFGIVDLLAEEGSWKFRKITVQNVN